MCTFLQPAFNYSPQAPQLSVRHRRKTPLGIKWRRPSSKIRDFCRSDIFLTALLLCSKLQLESLFGRRPLDRDGDDFCPYPPLPPTPGLQIKFYLLSVQRLTFSLSSTGTPSWPWARSWTPSRRSPTLRRTQEGRPGRSVPASPGS